jgi:hypothetical protein
MRSMRSIWSPVRVPQCWSKNRSRRRRRTAAKRHGQGSEGAAARAAQSVVLALTSRTNPHQKKRPRDPKDLGAVVSNRCLRMEPNPHPEPGFRWARAAGLRVHLTRDDHAYLAMYQARLRRALEQGNIKFDNTADKHESTPAPRSLCRPSEQMSIAREGIVEALQKLRQAWVVQLGVIRCI